MSRKYVVAVGLAAGLMFAGGGLAVAAPSQSASATSAAPTTTAAPSKPTATAAPVDKSGVASIDVCKKMAAQTKDAKQADRIIQACIIKFKGSQIRVIPQGAPQTGGGGMASVVSTWN
jgi:hypothetical protein